MHNTFCFFTQFTKDVGATLLKTFKGILQDLVAKLQDFPETTISEPAVENSQEASDLFLEANQSSSVEADKEKVRKFSFSVDNN